MFDHRNMNNLFNNFLDWIWNLRKKKERNLMNLGINRIPLGRWGGKFAYKYLSFDVFTNRIRFWYVHDFFDDFFYGIGFWNVHQFLDIFRYVNNLLDGYLNDLLYWIRFRHLCITIDNIHILISLHGKRKKNAGIPVRFFRLDTVPFWPPFWHDCDDGGDDDAWFWFSVCARNDAMTLSQHYRSHQSFSQHLYFRPPLSRSLYCNWYAYGSLTRNACHVLHYLDRDYCCHGCHRCYRCCCRLCALGTSESDELCHNVHAFSPHEPWNYFFYAFA